MRNVGGGDSSLYEKIFKAAVRHLKACCSEASFTDAEVREFLTKVRQADGALYTEDDYALMFSELDELPSEVAPVWLLDADHIKEPLRLEGLSFEGDVERIRDLLERLSAVVFIDCDFYIDSLLLDSCDSTFRWCRFYNGWHVTTCVMSVSSGSIFDECTFSQSVSIFSNIDPGIRGCASVFNDCALDLLEIKDTTLALDIFADAQKDAKLLRRLSINNAVLKRPLLLNHARLEKLCLQSSWLEDTLDLTHAKIQHIEFLDAVFDHAIAMNHSQVSSLLMERCDCRHVVDMGGCTLGRASEHGVANEGSIRFAFTTFHQNVSFRDTRWYMPLDLRDTIQKQAVDFKGFQLESAARKGTDRETLRMIRHSFDAVGNHVDAGRCYALEMEAYRREMTGRGQLSERFLLWCNSWMSYHGQSYLRPVGWIVAGMLLLTLVRYGYQANWLYRLYPPANDALASMAVGLNAVAESLVIFKPLMMSGMEMLSLLFGLWFSTLTWQAVVAMRRHTRK